MEAAGSTHAFLNANNADVLLIALEMVVAEGHLYFTSLRS